MTFKKGKDFKIICQAIYKGAYRTDKILKNYLILWITIDYLKIQISKK